MYLGVDVGRGYVKVATGPNHSDVIIFPSYAMPGKEMDLELAAGDPLKHLVAVINGEKWFIGELAKREGGTKEYTKEKARHTNTIPLLITGIALAAESEYVNAKVAVGLPIGDYKKQALEFEKKAQGYYRVQLPHKNVHVEIQKGNIICFPECASMIYDLIFGPTGHLNNVYLAQKKIAAVDVGWKTTNFAVMDNMEYIDSMSGTMPLGLSKAFLPFYKRIFREKDLTFAEAEQKFAKEGEPELRDLARQIRDHLNVWWPVIDEFDEIYLGGGGGAALARYFDIPFNLVSNSQTANARGLYKVAVAQL